MSHSIEPELQSPLPRPTRRRAGFAHLIFFRIFILPHILIGLSLLMNLFYYILHQLFGFTMATSDSVFWYSPSSVEGLLTTIFWNIVVLGLVWQFFIEPYRQWQLVRNGTPVVGRITARQITGQGRNTAYIIAYEYAADDAPALTGEMRLRKEDWDVVHTNVPVTVLYEPRQPQRSLIYQYGPYVAS